MWREVIILVLLIIVCMQLYSDMKPNERCALNVFKNVTNGSVQLPDVRTNCTQEVS